MIFKGVNMVTERMSLREEKVEDEYLKNKYLEAYEIVVEQPINNIREVVDHRQSCHIKRKELIMVEI